MRLESVPIELGSYATVMLRLGHGAQFVTSAAYNKAQFMC
jgi:hypothetical protein